MWWSKFFSLYLPAIILKTHPAFVFSFYKIFAYGWIYLNVADFFCVLSLKLTRACLKKFLEYVQLRKSSWSVEGLLLLISNLSVLLTVSIWHVRHIFDQFWPSVTKPDFLWASFNPPYPFFIFFCIFHKHFFSRGFGGEGGSDLSIS